MKFKVGDKVKIAKASEFYDRNDTFNPSGVGKIVDITQGSDVLPITVEWDKDVRNGYSEKDLVLFVGQKKKIGKSKAFELISNSKGHFITVIFENAKGELRTLNGRYLKPKEENHLGLVKMTEAKKLKAAKKQDPRDRKDVIRQFYMDKLKFVKIAKVTYQVK